MLVLTVGSSHCGRPIDFYLFNTPVGRSRPIPLDTLFIGAFHGDEPESFALLRHWLQQLCLPRAAQAPSGNVCDPFAGRAVGILPCLNPDGLAAGTRQNSRGVDLNRNFPTGNWQETLRTDPYYGGPYPASERETRLLVRLLQQYPPSKVISLHTPYHVLNYDGPEPTTQQLAAAMANHNGYPLQADIGYPTPGSFGTYLGIERQVPVITVELPEADPVTELWPTNQDAFLAAVAFPVITAPVRGT